MTAFEASRVSWPQIVAFLRSVARKNRDAIDVAAVARFAAQAVPWQSVLALAEMEGITGFLHRHRDCFSAHAPAQFLRQLERRATAVRDHTAALQKEADRIAAALDRSGLQVIALQGLSVLPLYGDRSLRPLGDVDLLAAAEQKHEFIRQLVHCGYRPVSVHYPDLLQKNGVCIDVHTRVLDRLQCLQSIFPHRFDFLRSRTLALHGRSIRVLDPIDNLMALCAHALKHGYARLIWLVDVHELILEAVKDAPQGWDAICTRARSWQQEKSLRYALWLLESMFGLAVPGQVKIALGGATLGSVERYLLRLIHRRFRSPYLAHGLYLHMLGGAVHKARFIKEALYPATPLMIQVRQHNRWKSGPGVYLQRLVATGRQAASDLKRAAAYRP